nr:hypothetical protein PCFP24_250 [Curtobacterium flaccumfaciens pv. poinsettiae]
MTTTRKTRTPIAPTKRTTPRTYLRSAAVIGAFRKRSARWRLTNVLSSGGPSILADRRRHGLPPRPRGAASCHIGRRRHSDSWPHWTLRARYQRSRARDLGTSGLGARGSGLGARGSDDFTKIRGRTRPPPKVSSRGRLGQAIPYACYAAPHAKQPVTLEVADSSRSRQYGALMSACQSQSVCFRLGRPYRSAPSFHTGNR